MINVDFNETFVGKTLTDVSVGTETIELFDENGFRYIMEHVRDCCEHVYVSDVCGDWEDIIGHKLLKAEETTQDMPDASESGTWTFYTFVTFKGTVTVRWNGESNGYYSERVDVFLDI